MKTMWWCGMVFALTSPTFTHADGCMDQARTQADLNHCAFDDFAKADRDLNSVYAQVLKVYKDDQVFLDKLKRAQLAWIAFRDAEFDARYPAADKFGNYGSAFTMCAPQFRAQLTRQRTETLRAWLKGEKEGDICVGSIRIIGTDTN